MKPTVISNKNQNFFKGAKVMAQYNNGNYTVLLLSDGTKIRYTSDNELKPEYPETIDLAVTKKCKQGCLFCYENCTPTGKAATNELIQSNIWSDIPPYTEVAINGNDMDWEYLENFLDIMYYKKVIVNITVTVSQFIENYYLIQKYKADNKIKGIGISLGDITNWKINLANTAQYFKLPAITKIDSMNSDKKFIEMLESTDDIVFHSILGINSFESIKLLLDVFKKLDYKAPVKILFLGYKTKGRGEIYNHIFNSEIEKNIRGIHDNYEQLKSIIDVMAFDNLAVEQLQLQELHTEEEWCSKYLGNDGLFSMYIDGVSMEFSKNSCTPDNERVPIEKSSTLKEIFNAVQTM